jgi:hypothetical protein
MIAGLKPYPALKDSGAPWPRDGGVEAFMHPRPQMQQKRAKSCAVLLTLKKVIKGVLADTLRSRS